MASVDFKQVDRFRTDSLCITVHEKDMDQAIDALNERIRRFLWRRRKGPRCRLRVRYKRQRYRKEKQLLFG